MNYSFGKSWYNNFRDARYSSITNNAKFMKEFKRYYREPTEVVNSKVVSGKLDVKAYVHEEFNGDTPTCIARRFINSIKSGYKWTKGKISSGLSKLKFW